MAGKRKTKKKTKRKTARKKTTKRAKGLWTKSEVNTLRKMFPSNPTSKIAKRLGRNTDAVKKKASRLGLKKTKKYLKSLGRK